MMPSKSAHACHGCNKPPDSCECPYPCSCGVCKSYRLPKDERQAIIDADNAKLTSPEEAEKLRKLADANFEEALAVTAIESVL
jgi:hypothetical protein